MSRSFKKHPIVKDNGKGAKDSKKKANQIVRRKYKNIDFPLKGNYYRKLFPQYDIHDWVIYHSLQQAINEWESEEEDGWIHSYYKTLEEYLKHWFKTMKRK